jgi:hypothetical protein
MFLIETTDPEVETDCPALLLLLDTAFKNTLATDDIII